jgi:hypothetical protein
MDLSSLVVLQEIEKQKLRMARREAKRESQDCQSPLGVL